MASLHSNSLFSPTFSPGDVHEHRTEDSRPPSPRAEPVNHHNHHHHHNLVHASPNHQSSAAEPTDPIEPVEPKDPLESSHVTSTTHSISPPPSASDGAGPQANDTPDSSGTEYHDPDNHHIIWNQMGSMPKGMLPHNDRKKKKKIFHMRGYDDQDDTDWWFASTACPLLAATTAPLANVLSIAALVTFWRMDIRDVNGGVVPDFEGRPYRDPHWAYWINVASLICGFVGNIFLLFNFTGRIRYIIALPVTIVLWYGATFLLLADTVSLHLYAPPIGPYQIYTQGFWYAVISIVLYFLSSSILMINMLGYFLGHYPQRFELNDHQRTLILQTMLFFIWLAGGGAMFSHVENIDNGGESNWAFVDGLYFCDVTILTLGFGDLVPHNNLGRGLVFPYSVGGIIMLGLVISSISKFAAEMSEENVVRKHADKIRARTLERTTSDPMEIERLEILENFQGAHVKPISAPFHGRKMKHSAYNRNTSTAASTRSSGRRSSVIPAVHKRMNLREAVKLRHKKIKLLRHEKDRFDEMRRIQMSTQSFKRWWALTVSVMAFATLWLVGAVVFWKTEEAGQGWTYFDGIYFSYVALLTIGYGDFSPTSNAGRSFFVVWSLIAVPTMTLLISDMSTTVIESFKRGTFIAADFTVMLKKNVIADFIKAHPRIRGWLKRRKHNHERRKRERHGLPVGDAELASDAPDLESLATTNDHNRFQNSNAGCDIVAEERGLRPSLDTLARQVQRDSRHPPNMVRMIRRLAVAIRTISQDLRLAHERQYSFEEWAELTRLIRFTGDDVDHAVVREEEDVIEWDWLGEDSPMMTHVSEPEFVLDHLCESLVRYTRRVEKRATWIAREVIRGPRRGSKEVERLENEELEDRPIEETNEEDETSEQRDPEKQRLEGAQS